MAFIAPFTDLVEAITRLRELVKLLSEDIEGSNVFGKSNHDRLKECFRNLYFSNNGILGLLKRYYRDGDTSVISEIGSSIDRSERKVQKSKVFIYNLRDEVGKNSMRQLIELDMLMDGKMGPDGIRKKIETFLASAVESNEAKISSDRHEIKEIIEQIEKFNVDLAKFHDSYN